MNIDENSPLIMAGDCNSIFDGNFDEAGGKKQGGNIVENMKEIINIFDLIDIWRLRNPLTKRFIYRQKTPLIQTRLDYFLVSSPCKT